MPDYSEGKIYSIRTHQTDEIYYGSTTQPLSYRFNDHKSNYKRYLKYETNYVSSFEVLKYNDAYIELVENYPCENREQLSKREGEIIRSNECVNKRIEGRTLEEWHTDNMETTKERIKNYYNKNRDKILQYQTKYRETKGDKIEARQKTKKVCECGTEVSKRHFSRHLQSIHHKEYINKQNK